MHLTSPSPVVTLDGLPILGSLLPLRRDALSFFTRCLQELGDRVQMKVPGRSILLLCHPQDIEHVLVRDRASYGRSAEVKKLRPIFGDGLLASEGDLWRRQRAMIQPSFQYDALAKYSSIMLHSIGELLRTWKDGQIRDIHADMMSYTRGVICSVLFGSEFLAGQDKLSAAVSTVFGNLRSEVLYLPIWRRLPFKRNQEWNRAVLVLNHAVSAAIRGRHTSKNEHTDLLAALLAARDPLGKAMSEEQLQDEILTFFLAGHETAALSLTWAMYLLARYPEMQQRVRVEVGEVTQGRDLRPEDYPKLRWTNAVIKEALRLYPPVWSMGREAIVDTTLDGYPVPKGTDIWICLHRTHRDRRWYDEPEKFHPERWLKDQVQAPYTYLPFGVGQRVCIGQHFAVAEAVLGLAKMLSAFNVMPASNLPAETSAWITLRPKSPIRLEVFS